MKKKNKRVELQARTLVRFNTGTRIHTPKKGKGSYKRIKKFNIE